MKKILCLILCAVMLLSVVACTDDETPPADSSSESSSSSSSSQTPGYTEPEGGYTAWDTEGHHIYVSASGHDGNDGLTKETAVETIYRANELAADYVSRSTAESEDVIIAIEGGTYYISETVKAVSGNENVNVYYTSYGDRKAEFIGAHKIDADNIKLCTDSAILNRIANADVRANLYEVDLGTYNDLMISIEALHSDQAVLPSGIKTNSYDSTMFYSDSQVLEFSRWPKADQVVDKMYGNDISGYVTTRYINYTDKNGEFKTPTQIQAEGGAMELPMNIFLSDLVYDKLVSWDVNNSEIYAFDFFSNEWDDNIHRVTSFVDYYSNNGNNKIYPDPANPSHAFKGYFTTDYGRKSNSELDGTRSPNQRHWFFFNILEEISANGEYYFDDENNKLYVYRTGALAQENLYVATLSDVMLYIGGAQNVSFINLDFKRSQTTMIEMNKSDNIVFKGCEIGQNNGRAMYIREVSNLTVKDTKIFETGFNAVELQSCSPLGSGPVEYANILFENCIVTKPSRVHYAYSATFVVGSVSGLTIRGCTLSYGSHSAVTWSHLSNFTMEYCDVHHFVTEVNDAGLFYLYESLPTQVGIIFRHNIIHDIGSTWQTAMNLFYQDSYSSGYTVYHNVIYNICAGDGWKGTAKGTIFYSMRAGLVYDNVVFNTSPNINISAPYIGANGPSDAVTSNLGFWISNIHSPETMYSAALSRQFEQTGFDIWEIESDDGRDHSYNMLTYLRSKEFMDRMLAGAIFVRKDADMWDKGATYFVEDMGKYEDVDGKNQGLEYLTVTYKKAVGSRPKGYVAKYGVDFNSLDDFYQLLYDDFGVNMTTNYGTAIPAGCDVEYRGVTIGKIYTSIYTLVTPDDPDTEEYDAVYKISKGVSLSIKNTGIYKITEYEDPNLFQESNFSTWGYAHLVAALYTNEFWVVEYDNNLTVGVGYHFSQSKDTFRNDTYRVTNSYDGAAVDFKIIENGAYTQDFLIYFDNILNNNRIAGFDLLDLSKVGSTLD